MQEWTWGQINGRRWDNSWPFDLWAYPRPSSIFALLKSLILLTLFWFFVWGGFGWFVLAGAFESLWSSSPRLWFKLRALKETSMNHNLQVSMTYCSTPEWKCSYWNVVLNNMLILLFNPRMKCSYWDVLLNNMLILNICFNSIRPGTQRNELGARDQKTE